MDRSLLSLALFGAIFASVTQSATVAPPQNEAGDTTVADCVDLNEDDCWSRPDSSCVGPYEAWSRAHCPLRCGYCPGKLPPCEDKNQFCKQYGEDSCVQPQFLVWARQNCRKHCNLCYAPTVLPTATSAPSTPPPTTIEKTTEVPTADTPSETPSTPLSGPSGAAGTTTVASNPETPKPSTPSSGPGTTTTLPGTVAVGRQNTIVMQGPPSSIPGTCQLKGQTYIEGSRWKDGCDFECTCQSASQNRILCLEQCNKWTLDESLTGCKLVREANDCCERLECD